MKPSKEMKLRDDFVARVGRALRRAARRARQTAWASGTPVYVWQDGKIIAEKPPTGRLRNREK